MPVANGKVLPPPVKGPHAKVRLRPKVPTISLPFRNTDSEAREPSPRLEKSSVKSTGSPTVKLKLSAKLPSCCSKLKD